MIYDLVFGNGLNFTQSVTTRAKYLHTSNFLTFTQQANTQRKLLNFHQIFQITQLLRSNNYFNRTIHQTLHFTQAIRRKVIDLAFYQHLPLWNRAGTVHTAGNFLQFYQTVIFSRNKGAGNMMMFSQSATCVVHRGGNITQHLNFVSTAHCVKLSRTALTAVLSAESIPHNNEDDRVVSFSCDNTTIVIPPPDFENTEKESFNRVNRRTRGGDLNIYRAPFWPKEEVFGLRWTTLTEKQANDFKSFLQLSVGKLVIYTDFEGRVFIGLIKTPGNEIIQGGRFLFAVAIEFVCQ